MVSEVKKNRRIRTRNMLTSQPYSHDTGVVFFLQWSDLEQFFLCRGQTDSICKE